MILQLQGKVLMIVVDFVSIQKVLNMFVDYATICNGVTDLVRICLIFLGYICKGL